MTSISYGNGQHPWVIDQAKSGRPLLDPKRIQQSNEALLPLVSKRLAIANKPPADRPVAIMPGILTAVRGEPNEGYVLFLNHLRKEVLKLGSAKTEYGLMTNHGLPGNLSQLLCVAGHGMRPFPSVDPFNGYRSLQSGFVSKDHERIALELRSCMLGEWRPRSGYRVARVSTYGMPFFDFEMSEKFRRLNGALGQLKRITDLIDRGRLSELYGDYQIALGYYSAYRHQADRAVESDGVLSSKERPSYGLEWITTDLAEPPTASKDLVVGQLDAFRTRVRLAYGLPGVPNYILGMLASGYRDVYLEEFAHTWKTYSPEDLVGFANGGYLIGVDVSNFDTTYPRFLGHFFAEGIAERFPALRSMIFASLHAPMFNPHRGGREVAFWTGSPFDPRTFNSWLGLPSGIAINPDMGKFGGTFQALVLFHELGLEVVGRVREILEGRHPDVSLKNSTDDMVYRFRDSRHRDEAWKLLQSPGDPRHKKFYFKLEVEDPVTYLGNAIYSEAGLRYRAEPSAVSLLVNWFVPERSAGSPFRPYPGTGWFAREEHFSKGGLYSNVATIRDAIFKHYFGKTPTEVMAPLAALEKSALGNLSEADKQLLVKPELLFYTDVAESAGRIGDLFSATVPASVVIEKLSPFMTGKI